MLDKSIVIISYHKYSETWVEMTSSIKKYIHGFNIFIITDRCDDMNYMIDGVYIIRTKVSVWDLNLKEGLKILQNEYGIIDALFTFDDLLLKGVDDLVSLTDAFNLIRSNAEIASIKLSHPHLGYKNYNSNYRYVLKKKYYTTLVYSIWKIPILFEILEARFDPWSFEREGYKYLKPSYIILTSKKSIIKYINTIVKGKVVLGLGISLKTFPKMNLFQFAIYKMKLKLIQTKYSIKSLTSSHF
jgi:hypothetical protein